MARRVSFKMIITAAIVLDSAVGQYLAGERPSISPNNSDSVSVVQGRSAYLVCRVDNINNNTISWIRHDNLAILSSGYETYGDHRLALYHKPGSGEWVLKIRFVRKSDAGVYECQVPTTPPIGHVINLNVIVPEAHIAGDSEFFVDIGSTLNLTCSVRNSPSPADYIFWYHNDSAIDYHSTTRISIAIEQTAATAAAAAVDDAAASSSTTTSHLLVTRAIATDSGTYTCSPANSRPATVKVHVLKVEIPAAMQTNRSERPALMGTGAIIAAAVIWTSQMLSARL